MARKNRYSGVLQPLPVGKGSPEVSLVLIYDIENDRLRTRASDICQDYGLQRIQYSAFFGKLNRNRRQELALKLRGEMGDEAARIRMIPICEEDLKDMWVLDQYPVARDAAKAVGAEAAVKASAARAQLRILRQEE